MSQKLYSAQNQLVQNVVGEAEELLKPENKEYEAGKKLLIAKRGAPKNKRLSKLLKEQGVAKLVKTVETDYHRDRKLHELDEELYFTIDESGHSAELTEKGRTLIGGTNPDFFVVPDLAELIGEIDKDESLSEEEKAPEKEDAHRDYADTFRDEFTLSVSF